MIDGSESKFGWGWTCPAQIQDYGLYEGGYAPELESSGAARKVSDRRIRGPRKPRDEPSEAHTAAKPHLHSVEAISKALPLYVGHDIEEESVCLTRIEQG